MSLLAACVGGVRPVPERLVLYRRHGSQQVGPRARPDATGGMSAVVAGEALGALFRANPYDSTLAVARAARDRLDDARARGSGLAKSAQAARSLAELDARIAHWDARRTLPRARLRRAAPVLKELLSLRYHRFANGLASAAKDLLS